LDVGLRLIGVAILFPLVSVVIGCGALARVAWLDRFERFAASWGVGFAVLALGQFLTFLTHDTSGLFRRGVVLASLAASAVALLTRKGPAPTGDRPPVGLWALGLAHLAVIQAILPAYIGGGWAFDWFMHYGDARVFLRKIPVDTVWFGHYTVASRTPLFNLVTACVMAEAGDAFWVYQWASVLTNALVALPVALVLRDLFGPRAAWLGLTLAPLNVWLLHEAWFTWSKAPALYYLMLALHFDLRWLRRDGGADRPFLGFAFATVLAFLTHQACGVYAAALAAHAAFVALRDPSRRPSPRALALAAAVAVVLVGAWYAWLASTFGLAEIVARTPTVGMVADRSPSEPPRLLATYARNLVVTVVPDRLIRAVFVEPFSAGAVAIHLTAMYFSQIPGALTLSLTAYLAARALRLFRPPSPDPAPGSREKTAVLAFATLGGLGVTVLHPAASRYGLGHNVIFPTTLVVIAWAWGVVARARDRWSARACLASAAESLTVLWAHVAWVYFYWSTGRIADDLNWVVQREDHLVFLHDLFPRAVPVWMAIGVAVEAGLVWSLIRWCRSVADRTSERPSTATGSG
jgi:hypothetical protein